MGRRIEAVEQASGRLPATVDEIGGPAARGRDPWGRRYRIEASSGGERPARIDVETLGADGVPGGGGEQADLVATCGAAAP